MSEIMTPGAPTTVPAGYAFQSLAGGFPSITLSANVAAADIIEFTGALTIQNITVEIPQGLFPTQVSGSVSYSGPTTAGWSKIIKNSTTGNFLVFVQGLGGTNTVTIPRGETLWVYSPDGLQVFAGSGAAGTGAPNAVFLASTSVLTSTLAALPGVPITGAAVGPVLFQGTRILIEANIEGSNTAGAVSAVEITALVDGVAIPKVLTVTPPGNNVNVTGTIYWTVANVPGAVHTIQLNLASGAGGTVAIDGTNNLQFANLVVTDLP